jgi:hypothetical protein
MLRTTLVGLLALALVNPAAAAGPYDDLLKHSPVNTNTIALIDVKGAFDSPLAKAEGWSKLKQANARGGLGFVPAEAEMVVIAAEVNYSTLARDFQVGLVKVRNVPTMKEVAAREGGSPDEIAGRLAVLSPRDAYFTTLSGSEFVATYPADRQYTARYLKAVKAGKTGQLSPYLRKAADNAAGNTVTIALDLEDVVDKTILKVSLPSSPSVAKVKTVDVNLLAAFLSNIKGMTFSAKVTDAIAGSIAVEFATDTATFRRTLPDLLREVLEGEGVAITGFEKWEPKFAGNTMTLSGPLTTPDLKHILSLLAFPQLPGEGDPMAKGNGPTASMTKRYLAAVGVILDDIKKMQDSPNYEKTATWHEKAAAQIEQLSRQNVDPVASEAALQSAKRLRAIAASLRGVPINIDALANSQYYYQYGGTSIGWWGRRPFIGIGGSGYTDTNIPKVQAEIQKTIADDKQRRVAAWSEIGRLMADAKVKLTDKYKTDF